MSSGTISSRIPELQRAIRQADSNAYLVEPRVVRRITRELHGFARLSSRIPHTEVLVARAYDIRMLAHPDELGLGDFQNLEPLSILVAQPEDHEVEGHSMQDLMQLLWSRLFHGRVDLRLKKDINEGLLTRTLAEDFIDRIGQTEFDEAHSVLVAEQRLFHPESRHEAWCELTATWLQLARFEPDLLPIWFPSLCERDDAEAIIESQLDAAALMQSTRLYGATEPDLTPGIVSDEEAVASERRAWGEGITLQPSARRYGRLLKSRERWNERGNTVAAGVAAMRAVEVATSESGQSEAREAARSDMATLASRLREALQFPEGDLEDWKTSLCELLNNSTHGFWNADKRLLYDLQKVCLDHERVIYKVDLVKWVVSRGNRPLRRPLKNLREVMMAKHLASSASRLVYVRLSGVERERLSRLLHTAADLAEQQMRSRTRPAVRETLTKVGLTPQSVPEQVALDKMVEESLDVITERGYLTMGYLRDAISRNDLKLPDLSGPRDLIRGDHLLRTDDQLDVALDGVYRRGEFYLRWLQVISSIAFGTRTGRFLTKFIVIPFGGAVILVEGAQHSIKVLTGKKDEQESTADDEAEDQENAEQTNAADRGETDDASPEAGATDGDKSPDRPTSSAGDDTAGSPPENTASGNTPATPTEVNPTVAPTPNGQTGDETTGENSTPNTDNASTVALSPLDEDGNPVDETSQLQLSTAQYEIPIDEVMAGLEIPLIALVGFMLMAVIHVDKVRAGFFTGVRLAWNFLRTVVYDIPLAIVRLPAVHRIWRARWFVKLRRHITTPALVAWVAFRLIPGVVLLNPQPWWLVGTIALLLSVALNSRLGRDAEELTAEWLGNAWYELRSRFLMALFDWVIDFFKWMLNLLERFIYAVDEWLRFHSGETWVTVVVKALLGVVWSFVSFLIRIYVNLLIEPTLHPVKHFPVVTVAHKIFLPVIIIIEMEMRDFLTPYLGLALAGPITWFNIVFLPGIFGFLVWELKENWRLYAANRVSALGPVIIGSHGETGGRMLKPGFHSGTLPKLFTRLRRLERKPASFQRFSLRRALRERLEHAEEEIKHFVQRDLIRVLEYCPAWDNVKIRCPQVHAASNSFQIILRANTDQAESTGPLRLLFQEQDGWLVASVAETGWLDRVPPEMQHSFETALQGFYKKAGVELVREQIVRNITGSHPYDISSRGLLVWPDRQFGREISIDLTRRHQLRPFPSSMAASYGIQPVSREHGVYSDSSFRWTDWQRVWNVPEQTEATKNLPLACYQSARHSLLPGSGRPDSR